MTLDELTPLNTYNHQNDLSYRDALAKALAGKLDVYYVFDGRSYVIYEPCEDKYEGLGTEDNRFGSENAIEREYAPCDFILLTPDIIRELWGIIAYDDFEVALQDLIDESAPEGFYLHKMLDGNARPITIDNLYVDSNKDGENLAANSSEIHDIKASNTALKVIGLLMCHLARSPKYASGASPNKSQIKELLLDLAEEQGINNYGLSKVDERLLAEAMKYLESQKL